ncbi:MAG: hypothetical protein OXR62_10810 [Ahrensia sp.]|nr:hypothetical protein [Ahrensia sp.]
MTQGGRSTTRIDGEGFCCPRCGANVYDDVLDHATTIWFDRDQEGFVTDIPPGASSFECDDCGVQLVAARREHNDWIFAVRSVADLRFMWGAY